ncbi:hypothetical protein [Brachybacterium timonense]|uniref:hypothetical protein n=1 Tax=Brachybacterium timonense TaxID=2050896 RepID=UPI000D0BB001|nr:hypothetical protein [Brachybacterium timonense]
MSSPLSHPDLVGVPQARFIMHWPWYVWIVLWFLPVLIALGILATGSPGAAIAILGALWVLVAAPLSWFLCRHRLVITDRAIVMGAFVPGGRPDVIFLNDVDPACVRTWSNLRAYLKAVDRSSFTSGMMITEGSGTGVSLRVRRIGTVRNGRLRENEIVASIGSTVELFALSGSAERFVHALTAAMTNARVPGAEQIPSVALPPGRLSGAPGSHRQEIPGWGAGRAT